ncbi:MAG TPA: GFA family protein [Candidatus Paceibacterota bacterium]|nr:GFA family protein [Candidatus Paceibacterota bacterium]
MKKYTGSCHCGKVRFEVETDLEKVISCNCSHCGRKGFLLNFVAPEQFTLLSGENEQTEYLFNKKNVHHLFCPVCGVESFARGTNPDGTEKIAVNVRCFENFDLESITPIAVNGKDF